MSEAVVESVELRVLQVPLDRTFWMSQEGYTTAGQLFVQVRTADGLVGYGQAHGNPLDEIAGILRDGLAPLALDRSAWDVRTIWQRMHATTYQVGEAVTTGQPHFGQRQRFQTMAAIAALDIALWDLRAKAAGQPLHRLLGSDERELAAYASGGYYPSKHPDELGVDALLEEISAYVDAGFSAVKMKVGRAPRGDIKRVAAVRAQFPEVRLLVDANGGWDVDDARYGAAALADYDVGWLEEPLHWYYPARELRALAERTRVPIAGGEQEPHKWAAAALVEEGGLSYLQLDCTRAGGITEWLDAAAHAAVRGVALAPHHDGQIHGHLLAGQPVDTIVETFPNEVRDPLWAQLYERRPRLEAGRLTLTEDPGLGFEPDSERLDRWTVARWTVTSDGATSEHPTRA